MCHCDMGVIKSSYRAAACYMLRDCWTSVAIPYASDWHQNPTTEYVI